jgi:hypothetical protein
MKEVDLTAVRNRLPRGSINLIAERLAIDPKIVSHVFLNGWYSEYKDKVLQAALAIIRGNVEAGKAITKEAEGLGLTTTSLLPIRKKTKTMKGKNVKGTPGFADLFELDRDELDAYTSENGLETNPDDFKDFWKGSERNRINLVYAICEELDMDVPDWDDIHEIERVDLVSIVEDLNLDINSEDYEENEELADEICTALGLEESDDSDSI